MKRILIACTLLGLLASGLVQAQPLFTYGPARVEKAEFLRAFLRNNNRQHPAEKDYRDYLELYTRYKLKVKAAYDMRLDTLSAQKAELAEFRKQLADGFLYDEASLQQLVSEAFERSLQDIHLAHLFIPCGTSGNLAADTAKAYRAAMDAYHELQKGSDFGSVAARYSADSAVRNNKGDLGYITVFTLPYVLENLAYATPAESFSAPYRSKAGYHIFKNMGTRKAAGRMKIAQVLFAFPPDADNSVKAGIKRRADSVYTALLGGASFTDMVSKYSNDNLTSSAQGQLQEFGVGQFDADFEHTVFSLPQNGSISKPMLTAYGYHIIKRLEHYPVNTDKGNEEAITQLRRQVMADARMEVPRQAMLQKMYSALGIKPSAANAPAVLAYADSLLQGKQLPQPKAGNKTVLLAFPKQQVYTTEWLSYLQQIKNNPAGLRGKSNSELLKQFQDARVKEYYADHLEEYNPEFAAQLQEFRDGNLLFEVMQRYVWDKAAADSAGLKKYFTSNAQKYRWKPSAAAIIFSCKDLATARAVREKLARNGSNWHTLSTSYENNMQADSGRFELGQLPVAGTTAFSPGMIIEPVTADSSNENNGFSFAYITRVYPGGEPRNFTDAKGLVLNDYQNFLEEQWIAALRKKYPVTVNEKVLATLWQAQ